MVVVCVALGPVCGVMLLATRNEFVVKHSFLSLYLPRTFVVAEGYVVVCRGCCWDYEDVSNLGVVGETSGLPLSGGHDGRCSCRRFCQSIDGLFGWSPLRWYLVRV